jgi:phage shock protein A
MPLINRLSRLFKADLHAVLDRIEEPEVLLRQAIREMEEELARERQRKKALNHDRGQLIARQAELDQTLGEVEEQLDVCIESERDDLARTLVRRKLEAQRSLKSLQSKRETLEETLAGLEGRLEQNSQRLSSLRQKAELLAEEDVSDPSVCRCSTLDFSVRDDDLEVALLREIQKRRPS